MEGLGRGKGTEKGVPGKIEDIVEGRKEEEGGVKNFELKVKSVFLPSTTRDLAMKSPKENHVECWSNLIVLKSCSNEIMHFFINGQADIGPNCCCAIRVITHDCWPEMLTSLGYSYHEALSIRGYCDAAASSPALAPTTDGPANPIY
ncbi:Egg cell-secreted protein 1.3 [Glycine soja]|uniref:Egg cell-secreted protein 1.3 n=1 Tax=Glycine soja TaxID=3848 RepID=A0A445JEP8_GLYSO|nr:Egg cell-secreted protein 1.3 [Glycine soja]